VFFYHFDAKNLPPDLDVQTGGGFNNDTRSNKIDTKYTCGVALMAAPFFITAGLVSRVAGYDSESGFSMLHIRLMSLAAVVYLILGLFFLKKFLDHYFQSFIVYFVITLIFLGTNLFYYSLIDGIMSHVYSFFLFSLFLFALKRFLLTNNNAFFILLSVCFSLVVLIRPTNIILGLVFFTFDIETPSDWLTRFRYLLKPRYILGFLVIIFIIFLPQMVYWKYLSGNWIHFSYQGEGFDNWRNPRWTAVLFSPVNGLFTYTPLAFIFIAGIGMMIFKKMGDGWVVAVVFMAVTLICSSWKMWYFGCSLGQRSFAEYYAVLAIPFGYASEWIFSRRNMLFGAMLLFILFFMVYFNLRYTISLYRIDRCYYGSTWDWEHYRQTVERAGIISPVHQLNSYENDFENLALCPVRKPSEVFTRSGQYSIAACENGGITPLYSVRLDDFGYPYPKTMAVELWGLKPGARNTGASLGYTVTQGTRIVFSDEVPADAAVKKSMEWSGISAKFIIPDVNDSSLRIDLFVRNPLNVPFYVDDLSLDFHYSWN
jgi:hypothetical protein